mgnify:CR=1 FL=1
MKKYKSSFIRVYLSIIPLTVLSIILLISSKNLNDSSGINLIMFFSFVFFIVTGYSCVYPYNEIELKENLLVVRIRILRLSKEILLKDIAKISYSGGCRKISLKNRNYYIVSPIKNFNELKKVLLENDDFGGTF